MWLRVLASVFVLSLIGCGSSSDDQKINDDGERVGNDEFGFNTANLKNSKICGDSVAPIEKDPIAFKGYKKEKLAEMLGAEGLPGFVHGAVHQYGHYLMNYGPTLTSIQLSLVPGTQKVAEKLATLNRHSAIVVKGTFLNNRSPLPHILVTDIEITNVYTSPSIGHNKYSLDLDELLKSDKRELFVKIHANVKDGRALVIGFGGVVLPVIVNEKHLKSTENLYRNDKVRLKIAVVRDPAHPERPAHLMTDPDASNVVTVVDKMVNCHTKKIVMTGSLVKYFKSPQINTDIYAIQQLDSNGIERNFTLFPDYTAEGVDFMELFYGMSEKTAKVWAKYNDKIVQDRNKVHSDRIQITATGWMNVVSKNQANPQIMIKSVDDIKFEIIK
jgi:hypothetical protein